MSAIGADYRATSADKASANVQNFHSFIFLIKLINYFNPQINEFTTNLHFGFAQYRHYLINIIACPEPVEGLIRCEFVDLWVR
jgi:hypothetical protein